MQAAEADAAALVGLAGEKLLAEHRVALAAVLC